jgi:cytoskeletal protein RodZ
MSDHDRGAYAPPTDTPLSFDARQPVRGARPVPFTLIISMLVLAGLGAAIFVFYQGGVRKAGQAPQAVGQPVAGIKAPPPAEGQPQDPAAGLQIYKTEGGQAPPAAGPPQFTAPPEQPQSRVASAPAPAVVVSPPAPLAAAQPAPALRPSIPAQPPAAATPAAPQPAPKAAAPAPKLAAAPPVTTTVAKAAPPPVAAKPAPAPVKEKAAAPPAKAEPAPAAKPAAAAAGGSAVQIGAFSSQALADKGWSDAAAIAPGLAAGKGKNVEKVDKDGKTLFRTQVTGFADRAAATAFCDKLKAAGKACFVK